MRYKNDAAFFQKLRASLKRRFAEDIDYRDYEAQIQKMLNTYVQADEVIQVVAPVNIFEREAFEAEVDKAQSPRAKADTIANRTKKTITEKMDEDPFFYRKFSVLLQLIIDDYKAARLSEAQYLAKVTAIMEQVRDGKAHDGPDMLRDKDLARAVYGAIKEHLAEPEPTPPPKRIHEALGPQAGSALPKPDDLLMAEAACEIETIIRNEAVVRWRDNTDAQNRMRNAMDDYLFKFAQERGVAMTLQQMDEIIESALHIARNRPQDA
jgi:type I restriction enzyme R subunit